MYSSVGFSKFTRRHNQKHPALCVASPVSLVSMTRPRPVCRSQCHTVYRAVGRDGAGRPHELLPVGCSTSLSPVSWDTCFVGCPSDPALHLESAKGVQASREAQFVSPTALSARRPRGERGQLGPHPCSLAGVPFSKQCHFVDFQDNSQPSFLAKGKKIKF